MTIEQLIEQFTRDAERGTKAIDRLTLRPTKHSAEYLKNWRHHVDVCVSALEALEKLQKLENATASE
ncbi:hypothetical protein [Hymenobacter crusticola]|uniref:Uncharacterized protein n=1 Tax=Hymenobacter crusticola TaxID=1770526 RepID=A0A243W5E6_9BACT|nr:hypothetical protein [Hymenobacter crusticola]OUJ68661.1 hypothetical protein BXP70_27625 [Hymenobacter crusticola]